MSNVFEFIRVGAQLSALRFELDVVLGADASTDEERAAKKARVEELEKQVEKLVGDVNVLLQTPLNFSELFRRC